MKYLKRKFKNGSYTSGFSGGTLRYNSHIVTRIHVKSMYKRSLLSNYHKINNLRKEYYPQIIHREFGYNKKNPTIYDLTDIDIADTTLRTEIKNHYNILELIRNYLDYYTRSIYE
jgi:hypothetical protein